MDALSKCFFGILLFLFVLPKHALGTACSSRSVTGKISPASKKQNLDSSTGITIFMEDPEYTVTCCGIITGWSFYARSNPGMVYFQVWRKMSLAWSLVGENIHSVTDTALNSESEVTLAASERTIVQNGDVIGLHVPGAAMITYNSGGKYKSSTLISLGLSTYDWDSEAFKDNRDYAFHAVIEPTTAPTWDNLDKTEFLDDALAIGYTVIILCATVDYGDVINTSLVSNDNPAMFEYDNITMAVRTTSALMLGTYTMVFQVSDVCGQTNMGTLTIVVTNTPPTINNLPFAYGLGDDQSNETVLYVIDTTDPSDNVSCSISAPLHSPFEVKLSSGSTNYAVYVMSNQNLYCSTQSNYALTIECTDGKDVVTGIFTVYLLKVAEISVSREESDLFRESKSDSDKFVNGYTLWSMNGELITCSLECVKDPCCKSFFYKSSDGLCYGYVFDKIPNTASTNSPGMHFYIV